MHQGDAASTFWPITSQAGKKDLGYWQQSISRYLRLNYNFKGHEVFIVATVLSRSFDEKDNPTTFDRLPEKKLGIYSLALHESVTMHELKQFGIQPVTLKIVTSQPEASARPGTVTDVPSIKVEIAGEDREFYDVALHNTSLRGVTAVIVSMPEGQSAVNRQDGDGSSVVIAPGAVYHLRFNVPHSGRMTPGGFLPDAPPALMVVKAALFEDGSSEGDLSWAADMQAGLLAQQIQKARIQQIVDRILASTDADNTAKLARLKTEVTQLSEKPDEETRKQVLTRLTENFGSGDWNNRVESSVQGTLAREKNHFLWRLRQFEERQDNGLPSIDLAHWLNGSL